MPSSTPRREGENLLAELDALPALPQSFPQQTWCTGLNTALVGFKGSHGVSCLVPGSWAPAKLPPPCLKTRSLNAFKKVSFSSHTRCTVGLGVSLPPLHFQSPSHPSHQPPAAQAVGSHLRCQRLPQPRLPSLLPILLQPFLATHCPQEGSFQQRGLFLSLSPATILTSTPCNHPSPWSSHFLFLVTTPLPRSGPKRPSLSCPSPTRPFPTLAVPCATSTAKPQPCPFANRQPLSLCGIRGHHVPALAGRRAWRPCPACLYTRLARPQRLPALLGIGARGLAHVGSAARVSCGPQLCRESTVSLSTPSRVLSKPFHTLVSSTLQHPPCPLS
ncbi:uncharacterized protein [Eulemur rufifrons]|uniref:uncharacterized protein n=1 Tax=Eulemur rufifrons TaxID=859984 RepID=UPI0037426DC0